MDFRQAAACKRRTTFPGCRVRLDALPEYLDVRRKPDHMARRAQAFPVRRTEHNAPARSNDLIATAAQLFQKGRLFLTKTDFSLLLEDQPDAAATAFL